LAELIRLPDPQALAQEAAARWESIAAEAVQTRGAFSVALSGGQTPREFYSVLAATPWRERMPWAKTFVFWGDERRVPRSDPASNYRLAADILLSQVPIPGHQVFPMSGEALASSAAREYDEALWRHFRFDRRAFPVFDLFLLGLGTDGHIASIFPGTRAVSDLSNRVLVYRVPQLGEERITLTLPVINQARDILILVSGAEKAGTLHEVLYGPHRPSTVPAQAVKPVSGRLTWLVDEAAAAELPA
jgi:6-phosphogluconolactonase